MEFFWPFVSPTNFMKKDDKGQNIVILIVFWRPIKRHITLAKLWHIAIVPRHNVAICRRLARLSPVLLCGATRGLVISFLSPLRCKRLVLFAPREH